MIYVLKIIWDYRMPLLELIVCNIARYPQSATSMLIRYQPVIRYLLPCLKSDTQQAAPAIFSEGTVNGREAHRFLVPKGGI
jgi:hypothetical protein